MMNNTLYQDSDSFISSICCFVQFCSSGIVDNNQVQLGPIEYQCQEYSFEDGILSDAGETVFMIPFFVSY